MTDDAAEQFKITDRTVSGDLNLNDRSVVPQISAAEFLERVDAVLDVPGVKALIWDQYTPYFNDGDPCEFSVNEVRVILAGDSDDDDEDEGEFDYGVGRSSGELWDYPRHANGTADYSSVWSGEWPNRTVNVDVVRWIEVDGVDIPALYHALEPLSRTAQWESVALKNFGDHATVRATKSGFSVDYYEHD